MFRKLNIFAVFICFCELVRGECDVVTKKEWGGLEPTHVQYLPRPVDLVIIQHTTTPMCTTDTACKNEVKSIQDYLMDFMDWWDIGSSFYVGGNGKVYEGPGWLHVGAHTYGYNKRSIGISFIGNYETDVPTAQQLNAVKALLRCGVENGHLTSNYHVIGAKQVLATLSPGRNLWAEIRTWPEWMDDVSSIKN
ncbi:peptidoglycan recognition protein-like isoform X3 [Ostrinia nubilalis]|uniref:peptidoglycan recognition protein-like isoform X3 n=1 Tax=Ostrinia nubilalis TaxID=29057 RepID=UPI0030825986